MVTPAFRIAELKETETGGFSPRGGAKEFWRYKGHEGMLAGPAETGKSWTCCQKLNALLWKYPGTPAVIARKLQTTLYGTVLQTFQRVAAPDGWDSSPINRYGGEKPEWFDYPNGSRLWVAGLDNPGKALSSERAFIYVCQAEDLVVDDWETLLTRATGRGVDTPYTQVFGDCNPGPPTHWILHRPSLKVFQTYHRDNPTLYTETGDITEQGKVSIGILSGLSGLRRARLFEGKWVQAEGVVYDGFNAEIHVKKRADVPVTPQWPRYWTVDFGYTNPFVWQEWVQDPDGRLYLWRELYQTKTLVQDALSLILAASLRSPRPRAIVCDHDAEDRATFEQHCIFCSDCCTAIRPADTGLHRGHTLTRFDLTTKPAHKAVSAGIQAVASRLVVQGDGKPRLFHTANTLIHAPDPALVAARKPYTTTQEVDNYVWDESSGRRRGEDPKKEYDHGQDAERYVVAEVEGLGEKKNSKTAAMDPLDLMFSFKR